MLVLPRMTSPPDPVAMGDKGRGDATVKEPSDKSFVQMLSSLVKAGGEPAAQLGSVQLGAAASPGRSNAARFFVGKGRFASMAAPSSTPAQAAKTTAKSPAKTVEAKGVVQKPGVQVKNASEKIGQPLDDASSTTTTKKNGDTTETATAAAASGAGARIHTLRHADASGGKEKPQTNEDAVFETTGTSTTKSEGGARVVVVDMRMKASLDSAARRDIAKGSAQGGSSGEAEAKGDSAGIKAHGDASGGFSGAMGRLSSAEGGTPDTAPQTVKDYPRSASQTFGESLASRIRDGATDIVRSAQVVLRDGGTGLIRLRLEPESLGGVKIELRMAEKQISGKIVVESEIAGEAFRSSLSALKDAFAESGFETTSLEVEVRNGMDGAGHDGRDAKHGDAEDKPYLSASLQALDAAVPALATSGRDGLLDVFV